MATFKNVVAAITGSIFEGATDDYNATLYVLKKECLHKDMKEKDDVGLPAEICLPVSSPLWNRLEQSLHQVTQVATTMLRSNLKKSGNTGTTSGTASSFAAKVVLSARSATAAAPTSKVLLQSDGQDPITQLVIFLLRAGDALYELGESTAAQILCYDPAARLLRGGLASIYDDGTSPNSNGYGQSTEQLRLRLSVGIASPTSASSGAARGPIVLHARAVFGGALSFAQQVANHANLQGGIGSIGANDPSLRYELTVRKMMKKLDAIREAMSLVVEEQKRGLLQKKLLRGSGGAADKAPSIPGVTTYSSTSSLYWLLQNGCIGMFFFFFFLFVEVFCLNVFEESVNKK
jgi:hypothetical protein